MVRARITEFTRDMLNRIAAAEDRSISSYISRLLEKHVGDLEGGEEEDPPKSQSGDAGYTYFIKSSGYYKIGRARNLEQRLSGLSLPEKPEVVAAVLCADYGQLEMAMHVVLANKRANGEWYRLTDADAEAVKRLIESRSEQKVVSLKLA